MSRVALSNTGDWELKFDEQDVRGFDALDADGNRVGEVETMVVNTDERRVDSIRLEDGTEYPASDISIGDGVVYLTTVVPDDISESVTVYDDYGHVTKREVVGDGDFDAYADDFRTHYGDTFDGDDFETYEPAYRYGYDAAYTDANRNRTFMDADADLESDYARKYPRLGLSVGPGCHPVWLQPCATWQLIRLAMPSSCATQQETRPRSPVPSTGPSVSSSF